MCLAVPGLITAIEDGEATVDYGAVKTKASLRLMPGAKVGDTALVHAGFVIQILDPEAADELRRLIEETGNI